MVTLGTHTPADGLRDTHDPTLRDLRTGGMCCVIDVLKGAEMFQPLTWRWHLSLILGALERVHDITRRTTDGHSSAYSTGVPLEARHSTLRRHNARPRRQRPPHWRRIAARRLSSPQAGLRRPVHLFASAILVTISTEFVFAILKYTVCPVHRIVVHL